MATVVPTHLAAAVPEVAVYLKESVGNSTRIDYGTGTCRSRHLFGFTAFSSWAASFFAPRLSGGSLSKQSVLASWVGCSAPGCWARCCSCSPDSVHQGELMPHASRSCVRRADASLCELIITTNTAVYRALAASQGSAYRSLERQKSL